MARLILVCGATGAGKTSYSITLAEDIDAVRFSIDPWMQTLYSKDMKSLDFSWMMERVHRCYEQIWDVSKQILLLNGNVILDLGFTTKEQRDHFTSKAKELGVSAELHYLNVPVELRKKRVEERNKSKDPELYAFEVTDMMFNFMEPKFEMPDDEELALADLHQRRPLRILKVAQALRRGFSQDAIHTATGFDPWFIEQIANVVDEETRLRTDGLPTDPEDIMRLKKLGFTDARLQYLTGSMPVSPQRVYKRIDTCAGEFDSTTNYFYSCYEGDGINPSFCESNPTDARKVMILGGGPNRIGQGIEFDYCCVHAAYALKASGYETIMLNCNPETVSTDFDTSDRLYFDPLSPEHVIAIARKEQERGHLHGVVVQFGGQTPLRLAQALLDADIPILGTSPDAIDLAEDRERFQQLIEELGLRQPANGIATSLDEAKQAAQRIGFPVLLRPSYVLGGRAMEIIHDMAGLEKYIDTAVQVSGKNPVLVDSYLTDATEVDVDAICDGNTVYVAGIMEHIEEAGIHSGDSACVLPPHNLSVVVVEEIKKQTATLAKALGVKGLVNVQFAVHRDTVYVLEVNPRASRTVPFVAKATGVPVAKIAARVMAGDSLERAWETETGTEMYLPDIKHVAVKEAVFPFNRFPGVDLILGPEMRSTGEVMGLAGDFATAFHKAQLAAGTALPMSGKVFISIQDHDKSMLSELGFGLIESGFSLVSTDGTAKALEALGIEVQRINKVFQGSPHIVDAMLSGDIALVINTVEGAKAIQDSHSLRQTALKLKIPYTTTMAGALAAVKAIHARQGDKNGLAVKALQAYFG